MMIKEWNEASGLEYDISIIEIGRVIRKEALKREPGGDGGAVSRVVGDRRGRRKRMISIPKNWETMCLYETQLDQ